MIILEYLGKLQNARSFCAHFKVNMDRYMLIDTWKYHNTQREFKNLFLPLGGIPGGGIC